MNHGDVYEAEKTEFHNRGRSYIGLLPFYGAVSICGCLFRAEGDFPLGYQRASGAAALFHLREFFELHGGGQSDKTQSLSLCHERAVRLSQGSEDHRGYEAGECDFSQGSQADD